MPNIKISDLVPDDKNYNKGNAFGNSLIEKSLRKHGAGRSILLDKNNRIIAGNKTIQNAGAIEDIIIVETTGNQIVAVKRTDIDLDSKKGREMALADNATAKANIEWDTEALSQDWTQEEQAEWGIIEGFETAEAVEDDYEIPDDIETDIVLGDLFEIGQHRLLCGDSTDSDAVATLMNGHKADMVFTDPPYGMFLNTDWSSAKSSLSFATEKNALGGKKHKQVIGDHNDFKPELITTVFENFSYCPEIFLWGADYYADLLQKKNEGSWVVWDKRLDESADKMYGSCFELCWSKAKHKRMIARIKWAGIFGTEKEFDHKRHHPTQKPVALVAWFFDYYSFQDKNIVSDLYLGAGTTMVAAHQLNRKCYGMEIDPKYCQVIVDRMLKLDPSLQVKKNGLPLVTVDKQLINA